MLSVKVKGEWYHRLFPSRAVVAQLEADQFGYDWFFILWGDSYGQSV